MTKDPTVPPPAYTERAPDHALAACIECYWQMQSLDAALESRIVPDGCADIIVDRRTGEAYVIGTMRRAIVVSMVGEVDLFGVRFRSGTALSFLDAPLSELTDQRVPLEALWGSRANDVRDLLTATPPRERPREADRLFGRLRRPQRREELLVERAVALLRRARGSATVRDVAAALGVGERRLERAFDQCIGLGPKAFARVMRFRHAVQLMHERGAAARRRPIAWTPLALAAGYADQSHFIREFKALAGVTPAAYAAEPGAVGFVQYDEADGL